MREYYTITVIDDKNSWDTVPYMYKSVEQIAEHLTRGLLLLKDNQEISIHRIIFGHIHKIYRGKKKNVLKRINN